MPFINVVFVVAFAKRLAAKSVIRFYVCATLPTKTTRHL